MHEQGEAEAEQDLDRENDQRVDAGGPDRLVEQRIRERPGVVERSDERSVLGAERLDDDEDEWDGDDDEDRTERRQEDQVSQALVPAEPPPTGPHSLHSRADRSAGRGRITSSI